MSVSIYSACVRDAIFSAAGSNLNIHHIGFSCHTARCKEQMKKKLRKWSLKKLRKWSLSFGCWCHMAASSSPYKKTIWYKTFLKINPEILSLSMSACSVGYLHLRTSFLYPFRAKAKILNTNKRKGPNAQVLTMATSCCANKHPQKTLDWLRKDVSLLHGWDRGVTLFPSLT